MAGSVDIALWHGWHVTIFHPWIWLLVVGLVVAAITLLGRIWLSRS